MRTTAGEVLAGSPAVWKGGVEDASSGDRAWWFDFSQVTVPGDYYVLDVEKNVRSAVFRIGDDVYRDVLRHAVRTFFYQRAGFAKEARYAGEGWADGASHIGPLQDKNCRLYNRPADASTERDLSGGWYDAGDYNKYTNWTAEYVIELLRAYDDTPAVFTDDFSIPESGNGIPDILDETKWGMDWLVRMQNPDGSVLSIVGTLATRVRHPRRQDRACTARRIPRRRSHPPPLSPTEPRFTGRSPGGSFRRTLRICSSGPSGRGSGLSQTRP